MALCMAWALFVAETKVAQGVHVESGGSVRSLDLAKIGLGDFLTSSLPHTLSDYHSNKN